MGNVNYARKSKTYSLLNKQEQKWVQYRIQGFGIEKCNLLIGRKKKYETLRYSKKIIKALEEIFASMGEKINIDVVLERLDNFTKDPENLKNHKTAMACVKACELLLRTLGVFNKKSAETEYSTEKVLYDMNVKMLCDHIKSLDSMLHALVSVIELKEIKIDIDLETMGQTPTILDAVIITENTKAIEYKPTPETQEVGD